MEWSRSFTGKKIAKNDIEIQKITESNEIDTHVIGFQVENKPEEEIEFDGEDL